MTWPKRDRICLDCRTLLPPETPCPGGARHRLTRLDIGGGRERLLEAVWGPAPWRQEVRAAARTGATGGGLGGLDACSGCDALGFAELGHLGAILIAMFVLTFAIAAV